MSSTHTTSRSGLSKQRNLAQTVLIKVNLASLGNWSPWQGKTPGQALLAQEVLANPFIVGASNFFTHYSFHRSRYSVTPVYQGHLAF